MADLGMPLDAVKSKMTIHYGDDTPWLGMHKHMLGMRVCATSAEWPPAWPYFRYGPFVTQVWLEEVEIEGVDAFVRGLWSPTQEYAISVMNVEALHSEADLSRVNDAVRLLKLLEPAPQLAKRRGRPLNSGRFASADEFHRAYNEAHARLLQNNIRPTIRLMAYHLCTSERALERYQSKWGKPASRN